MYGVPITSMGPNWKWIMSYDHSEAGVKILASLMYTCIMYTDLLA